MRTLNNLLNRKYNFRWKQLKLKHTTQLVSLQLVHIMVWRNTFHKRVARKPNLMLITCGFLVFLFLLNSSLYIIQSKFYNGLCHNRKVIRCVFTMNYWKFSFFVTKRILKIYWCAIYFQKREHINATEWIPQTKHTHVVNS